MKKQKTNAGMAFNEAKPALLAQINDVLEMAKSHRFKASMVYAAHNAVFDLNETPEVCASCNKKRVDALRRWISEYNMWLVNEANAAANEEGKAITDAPTQDPPRKVFTDLDELYANYGATIVGADTQTTDEAEGERAGIAAIWEKHGTELSDSEKEMLANRLNELDEASKNMDDEKAGDEKSHNVDTADYLDLKNKKGEYFQALFNSEDGVNGALVDADGNSLKPGTYSTEMGDSYAVQPGGKATYKNDAI